MHATSLRSPAGPLPGRNQATRHQQRPRRACRPPAARQQPASSDASSSRASSDDSTSRRRLLGAACGCAACSRAAAAAAATGGKPRNALLDESFALAMAQGMKEYEESIVPVKRQLFGELFDRLRSGASSIGASGSSGSGSSSSPTAGVPLQLLELGVGTGPNLRFYTAAAAAAAAGGTAGAAGRATDGAAAAAGGAAQPASVPLDLHITGVDYNEYMRPHLQDNLEASGWPADRFTWVQGDVSALPLGDASQDAVVCTLVLCSVPDVRGVLAEAARVLKPGGTLLFIEHTSAQSGRPLLWCAQRVLEPLQRLLADNCHLTRDPLPLIEERFGSSSGSGGGGVEARRFSVDGASLIAPHVAGLAWLGSGSGGSSSPREA